MRHPISIHNVPSTRPPRILAGSLGIPPVGLHFSCNARNRIAGIFDLLAILTFCLVWPSFLSAVTVSELQEEMARSDSTIKSMSFGYIQEVRSSLTSEVQTSSGIAYFSKPRNLRIEQKEPERQLIVSSGKTVFIYTPRFHQVIKDSWNNWFSKNSFFPGLVGFSETLKKLKKDYNWTIVGVDDLNGEETFSVRLENAGDDTGQRLNLWVGKADFIPRKTEVITGTLKLTTTLVSLKKNPELDAELFHFVQPEDSEMIEIP